MRGERKAAGRPDQGAETTELDPGQGWQGWQGWQGSQRGADGAFLALFLPRIPPASPGFR